jgi:ATP-binding cassette subfamily B protein
MANIRDMHDTQERMNAAGVEYVRGMPAVKVFGLTVSTFLQFHNSITGYRDWAVQYVRFCKRPYMVFITILASLIVFILPVGVFILSQKPDNQAFALTLMLFLVVAPGFVTPMMKLMNLGGNMRIIAEGVERIDEIFAQEPVAEPINPQKAEGYNIEFDHVVFSYDDPAVSTRTEALAGVSFTAREGELTALVGPSGGGKSTIAYLIPRFWDVGTGAIRIGGVDIREANS